MRERNLITLGILVVLTAAAAGFIFLRSAAPAQKTSNTAASTIEALCTNFPALEGEISCKTAAEFAIEKYPGSATTIQKLSRALPDSETQSFVWLITVKLAKPLQLPSPPSDSPELAAAKEAQIGVETTEKKVRFIQPIFEQ